MDARYTHPIVNARSSFHMAFHSSALCTFSFFPPFSNFILSINGACSVAASYKPPMLVTRVRLPPCASFLVLALVVVAHALMNKSPATRNRTRDHLIAAVIYSQMLYQLSYSRRCQCLALNVTRCRCVTREAPSETAPAAIQRQCDRTLSRPSAATAPARQLLPRTARDSAWMG